MKVHTIFAEINGSSPIVRGIIDAIQGVNPSAVDQAIAGAEKIGLSINDHGNAGTIVLTGPNGAFTHVSVPKDPLKPVELSAFFPTIRKETIAELYHADGRITEGTKGDERTVIGKKALDDRATLAALPAKALAELASRLG